MRQRMYCVLGLTVHQDGHRKIKFAMSSFATLAVDSEALLRRQVGPSGIPFLQRSLEELEAESARLGKQTALKQQQQQDVTMGENVELGAASAGAASVLSGQNLSRLQRVFLELERRAAYASVEEAGDGEDFDVALGDRAEQVVATAIEGAIGDALGEAERLAATQVADAWALEKQNLLSEMGLKALPWQREEIDAVAESSPSFVQHSLDARDLAHGEVVRKLNEYASLSSSARAAADSRGALKIFAEFGTLSAQSPSCAAWRIGHALAREDQQLFHASREISAAEATRRAARAAAAGDQGGERWLARARRVFLESLYASFVDDRLREAADTLKAHAMGVAVYEAADDACRFVALQATRGQLPRATLDHALRARGGQPVWPQIYVALRSGGSRGALDVAEACRARLESGRPELLDAVLRALGAHSVHDAAVEESGWLIDADAKSMPPIDPTTIAQLVSAVEGVDAASRTSVTVGGDERCPYEAIVINLICCVPSAFSSSSSEEKNEFPTDAQKREVFRTVEDYLWGELWRASFDPSLLQGLAATVQRFGPAHFDPTGEHPFQYASVLLHAGAVDTALAHIAAARQFPHESLHLAFAFDSYGLLRESQRKNRRAAALAVVPRSPKKQNTGGDDVATFDMARATRVYAHHVAAGDPALGLEYVGWRLRRDNLIGGTGDISAKDELRRSLSSFDEYGLLSTSSSSSENDSILATLVSLVLETRAAPEVVGSIDPARFARDSSRASLDGHLGGDDALVKAVLAVAARVARAHGDADLALQLFDLAGDDVAVVELFADQLARLSTTRNSGGASDGQRSSWLNQARIYADQRLSSSHSSAIAALTVSNKLKTGHAFQVLLNLAAFFDMCDDHKFPEALDLLDSLKPKLLPAHDRDLGPLLDNATNLDHRIHQIFPDLLLKTADCLYELHKRTNQPLVGYRQQQILRNSTRKVAADKDKATYLRHRAELLVNLAGLIKIRIPPDVKDALNRYEAMMI